MKTRRPKFKILLHGLLSEVSTPIDVGPISSPKETTKDHPDIRSLCD